MVAGRVSFRACAQVLAQHARQIARRTMHAVLRL
jgi:hypothetical protein